MSRILVVTNDYPPRRGGIETFVHALCRNLHPEEVVVYTASMPGDARADSDSPFPVYRDPSSVVLPLPSVARRVSEVMRRHGCESVVFGASAPLGLLGRRLRREGAVRLVALSHGHEVWWARVPVTRSLLRRIGDSVDVMTYVSEWCRERIAPALSSGAAARMQPLSPGVDTDRFFPGCGGAELRARLEVPDEAPVVVCVARMVARKGQDVLVEAWPRVLARLPDARLLLVGDGPHRRTVEDLARRLDVLSSVVFAGSVPQEEVPGWTDAGDVFAMPCRSRRWGLEAEAFGIVFQQAQACGLPVLIGDSGGAPESLLPDGSGVVVQGRHGPVADALVALLSDRGAGRRPVAAESLSWRSRADQLRVLLELVPPSP